MIKYILITGVLLIAGCKKKEEPNPISLSDRQVVLNNIGFNVAIRSFLTLQSSVNLLQEYANSYINDSTNMQKLLILQNHWLETAINWKHASLYNFGPMAEESLSSKIYSVADEPGIDDVVSTSGTTFDTSYISTLKPGQKGLRAVEYLIYGKKKGDNNGVIESFRSSKMRRAAYLRALCTDLRSHSDLLMYKWSEGGANYLAQFLASDGVEGNSSMALLSKNIIDLISTIRTDRIGLPLGVLNGEISSPQLVDGKYSDKSLELLTGELQCLNNAFTGKKIGTQGINGINYLLDKAAAKSGDELLSEKIMKQFKSIDSKMEVIQISLSEAVVTQPTQVKELYTEVENMETLLKTEMLRNLHLKN